MFKMLSLYTALASLLAIFWQVSPALAAEPVEVKVLGVEGAALKNVDDALALPYGLVRDGKVDRLWLDRFALQAPEKAKRAVEPFGYYHPEISAAVQDHGNGKFLLLVKIVPGEPVRIVSLDIELKGAGAGEAELRRLVRAFPLKKGQILVQPEYERAKSNLKAQAVNLGYLDADFSRHEIRIAAGEKDARLAVTLDTGERYYFDDVSIEGASEYPQPFLKRYITFKKGEVFSFSKLGETQLNFSNSTRFKEVLITPDKAAAKDHQVPVLVKLTPAPRRTLRPGVGYGTDTGPRASVHFRELNLFHKGHDLDLMLYAAQRLQGFMALYTVPSARDILSNTTFQLNLQQEQTSSYTSQLAAFEVDYNRSLGKGELLTPYVKIQQEDFTIGIEKSSSRLVLPGLRFAKQNFDNLSRPTRGYRYAFDLRGAHQYFGSDSALVQFITDGNAVLPLPWRLSLHVKSRVGLSMLADPLADFPPSIRFFAGGDQSVRGYHYQSLGPRNSLNEVVGGKDLIQGTVELERAIFDKWGVSLFHDAGNAFNDFSSIHLYQGAGVGLHYYTPIGGLHLDLAKRIGTGQANFYMVHFSVGFQL
ncbi:MAG TPA: autotransporter assembly complex family protein [Geomonas sp.]|nr:autotransporter assembly complex family protein [Geomonas sp.]